MIKSTGLAVSAVLARIRCTETRTPPPRNQRMMFKKKWAVFTGPLQVPSGFFLVYLGRSGVEGVGTCWNIFHLKKVNPM